MRGKEGRDKEGTEVWGVGMGLEMKVGGECNEFYSLRVNVNE